MTTTGDPMTETTLPSREQLNALQADADQAAARAAAARAELARQQQALDEQRQQRRLEHIARRAEQYDRGAARKAVIDGQRALVAALDDDPLIGAFARWQLARLQEHRLQTQANSDAAELGRPEPFRDIADVRIDDLGDTLRRETELLILDRLGQWESEMQDAFYAETLADLPDRTPAEHAAYEAEQEAKRRREAAVIGPASVDVTGMSPEQRQALKLPADLPARGTRGRPA